MVGRKHPFKRTLSTPLIMQYQSDVRFRSRDTHAQGGGTPKREKEKKQPNLVMPIAIGLFIVGMIVSIAYKSARGSRGSCMYDNVYRKVSCKGKQLTKFPTDLNEAALSIHMGSKLDKAENFFTKLAPDNFTKFVHLQELRLIKCGIEEIAPNTFEVLPELERLDLRYNRIQVITEETFKGMDALEYLYLSNNPIQRLGDNLFKGLSIDNLVLANNPALEDISGTVFTAATIKAVVLNRCNLSQVKSTTFTPLTGSLKELYLTHNMQPLDLPDGLFTGLKLKTLSLVNNGLDDLDFLDNVSAEEIHLDDNPIPELDCDDCRGLSVTRVLTITKARITQLDADNLSSLSNLEELDLDGNDLTAFNATAFEDLDNLDILDLSNNEIEDFEGNFSNILEDLDSLFLDGNEIQSLPLDMEVLFSRVQNLTLHDNPLHCNCELRWLAKWLEGDKARRILQQLDEVSCATPEAVNFTLVSDYGFQCRPPAIFNATMDSDGISLVCTADGDPAPKITWLSPDGAEKTTVPDKWEKDIFQTRSSLTVTKEGNYTCIASNVVGEERITVDTRNLPTSGLKLRVESREIEILETPQGFMITLFFMALLGYYFRVDSLQDLKKEKSRMN